MEVDASVPEMASALRRSSPWLLAGLLCATGLVVFLGLRLRSLRVDHAALQERESMMTDGMYVPRLDLELAEGGRTLVGAPSPGTWQVWFLYNTTCGFCAASIPAWLEVARKVRGPRVDVYGLSLDSLALTRRFIQTRHVSFPSALLLDYRSRALLHADAVPQTLVIDADGQVLRARPGTLDLAGADSIVALLHELVSNGARIR
jgi:peroxiredoxin